MLFQCYRKVIIFAPKILCMKYRKINIVVFIGIVAIIILQILWLYKTYTALEKNLYKECNTILLKAIRREISIRFQEAPQGTEIVGTSIPSDASENELAPEIVSLNEGLSDIELAISLIKIDSIASGMLKKSGLQCPILINKIDSKNQKVLSSSNSNGYVHGFGIMKSKIIPITSDLSQGIQMVVISPHRIFLRQMGLLIIATIIIMFFVIGCITYQIKIISRINKISQIREDFSYAMVHDMKTPLTTIFTALSFLHSGRLDDKPETKEKFFNVAKEEADRLLTLTNKLLTISKLENKKMKMECEKIALEPMLVRLADKFKVKSHKPVSFEFDLQTPEIYADAEYIEEVFSNLIDNSIKYSKERVDIRISSSRNDLYSIIKIYDNGLGISEKDQRSIFNKYERAAAGSRSRRKKAHGFGLGLNFVQQVIESHKGKIFVNSIEGEFTEFIIYLPLMVKEL